MGYFGVEFAVATRIGPVSLLADSIDFLEDTSVNLLIQMALAWPSTCMSMNGEGARIDHGCARYRDAVDGVDQARCADRAGDDELVADRGRRAGGRSFLRYFARALSISWWEPDARGVPVSASRCPRQHRDHRSRDRHRLRAAIGLAGPDRGFGKAVVNADSAREICQAARREHRAAA